MRFHLLLFSLAAPLSALLTYLTFSYYESFTGSSALDATSASGAAWLGLLLLFSAGTFLFTIAVHILPEISKKEGDHIEWKYVLCLIIGILAPLLIPEHEH